MVFSIFKSKNQLEDSDSSHATKVYSCFHCGRLYNYVSMPCPNCGREPNSIKEMAGSLTLSNSHFKISALLILAREIGNERAPGDVIPNFNEIVNGYLNDSAKRADVETIYNLLKQNSPQNSQRISQHNKCSNCGKRVFFSSSINCDDCDAPVNWSPSTRLLVCIDNLLFVFEQRIEPSSKEEFSYFVEILVKMFNNLLRRNRGVSLSDKEKLIDLLIQSSPILDKNKGAVVDISNTKEVKAYIIKDSMDSNTETYASILCAELENLIKLTS